MSRLVKTIAALVVFAAGDHARGQSATPFKLGTFEHALCFAARLALNEGERVVQYPAYLVLSYAREPRILVRPIK